MVGISVWSGCLGSTELPANISDEKPSHQFGSSSKIIWEFSSLWTEPSLHLLLAGETEAGRWKVNCPSQAKAQQQICKTELLCADVGGLAIWS